MVQLATVLYTLLNIICIYLFRKEIVKTDNHRRLQGQNAENIIRLRQNRGRRGGNQMNNAARSRQYTPSYYDKLVTNGEENHAPQKVTVRDDYVIATLVTESNVKYRNALRIFILSLRRTNYRGKIVIVIAKNIALNLEESVMKNVVIKPVDMLEVPISQHLGSDTHYSKLLTKLHIWSLYEYKHVVYYDTDMVFLNNPIPGIKRDCPRDKKICAVLDEGAKIYFHKDNYMNAGFLVIQPNKEDFQYLLKNKQHAEGKAFVEQDMLNILYKQDWFRLNPNYNHMHLSVSNGITPDTIAIHEKYWLVHRLYPNLLGGLQASLEPLLI